MVNIKNKSSRKINRLGMTLIEILIVVSLISGISIVLYGSLSNGLKVWEKSQETIVEEDVVVFLDKLAVDLRNIMPVSNINMIGNQIGLSIPAIVWIIADANSDFIEGEYIQQIGLVNYVFDSSNHKIIRREADYGSALSGEFLIERSIVSNVINLTFEYYYYTDQGEMISDVILDVIPAGVKVHIEIEAQGQTKFINRYIEIPMTS